jgi:hypothetical protein
MADSKISALPASTTPLAGTEVLPIVQSSATVKVAVSDLTAGRSISVSGLTNTGLTASKPVFTDASKVLTSTGVVPVANGGTNASAASITAFNNITGYTAAGATGTTSTNLVFSTSPSITTPTLVGDVTASTGNLVIGTSGKGIDFSITSHPAGMTSELFADYEEGTFTPTDNSGASLSFTQTGQATYVKSGKQVTCTMDVTYPVTASTAFASIAFPFATATSSSFVGQIGYQSVGSYLSPSGDNAGFVMWNIAGSPVTNASLSTKRLQISFTYRSAT